MNICGVMHAGGLLADTALPSAGGWTDPNSLGSSLQVFLLFSVLSLLPSLLVMCTCFVRIIVVLALVRQGLGAQQVLPQQVLTGVSLLLTVVVMWPVGEQAWREGIEPYTQSEFHSGDEQQAALQTAVERAAAPFRAFMTQQIQNSRNEAAIDMFLDYQAAVAGEEPVYPEYYEDVPWKVLLPAYVLSELKTAFLIGVQIYLPFLVVDLLCSSVLVSLGLSMLSPTLVSFPMKLLVFVLVDGWQLTVQALLASIHVAGG
jgi:flagellar biosynthetic protein FliP